MSDDGISDHMEEECRSSEGQCLAPGSDPLTDIPMEGTVVKGPKAVGSSVRLGSTGSDSQRIDS